MLDVLLVGHVHSLSRRVRHLHFLLGKLDSYGVAFHSAIDQSLDTSTPEGRFQVQMLGSFTQFEEEGVLEDRRAARGSSTGLSDGYSPGHDLGREITGRQVGNSAAIDQ